MSPKCKQILNIVFALILASSTLYSSDAGAQALLGGWYTLRSEFVEKILDACSRVSGYRNATLFVSANGMGSVEHCELVCGTGNADSDKQIIGAVKALSFADLWYTGKSKDVIAARVLLGVPAPSRYDTEFVQGESLIEMAQKFDVRLGDMGDLETNLITSHGREVVPSTLTPYQHRVLSDKVAQQKRLKASLELAINDLNKAQDKDDLNSQNNRLKIIFFLIGANRLDDCHEYLEDWLSALRNGKNKTFFLSMQVFPTIAASLLRSNRAQEFLPTLLASYQVVEECLPYQSADVAYQMLVNETEKRSVSLPILYQCLRIRAIKYGDESSKLVGLLSELAQVQKSAGDLEGARRSNQLILQVGDKTTWPRPFLLNALMELADISRQRKLFAAMQKYCDTARLLVAKKYMPVSCWSWSLSQLGQNLVREGNLAQADWLVRNALPTETSMDSAPMSELPLLVDAYVQRGQYQKALSLLDFALKESAQRSRTVGLTYHYHILISEVLLEQIKNQTATNRVNERLFIKSKKEFDQGIAGFIPRSDDATGGMFFRSFARHRAFLLNECGRTKDLIGFRQQYHLSSTSADVDSPLQSKEPMTVVQH